MEHSHSWPRRGAPRRGKFKRAIVAIMLALSAVVASYAAVAVGPASQAKAESSDGRAITAGVDRFGNRYLFWQGTNGTLWETYYNAYTGSWVGPTNIGMGQLGSTPTLAVAPEQVFAGPGGNEFSGQYVYWEGQNGNLWMAYWSGSWHGPISLGFGPLGSEPTATANSNGAGQVSTNIYWEGQNGNVWSAYSLSSDPVSASDYSGPHAASYGGNSLGPLGSSPNVSTAGSECLYNVCSQDVRVEWQGTNSGGLWFAYYDLTTQAWVTGATKFTPAGNIGGAPASTYESHAGDWYQVWPGENGYLWEEISTDTTSPSSFASFGILGSAPVVTETNEDGISPVVNIYWVGDSGNYSVWNANWTQASGWVLSDLPTGSVL